MGEGGANLADGVGTRGGKPGGVEECVGVVVGGTSPGPSVDLEMCVAYSGGLGSEPSVLDGLVANV